MFDTHDGTDIFRFSTVVEVVHTNDGFEGELFQTVHNLGSGAVFVKSGHFEVVIFQTDGGGDSTGTSDDVADSFRTVEDTDSSCRLTDGDGQQVTSINSEFGEIFEVDGDRCRDGLALRNDGLLGGESVIFGIEQSVICFQAGVIGVHQGRVYFDADVDVTTRRLRELSGDCLLAVFYKAIESEVCHVLL